METDKMYYISLACCFDRDIDYIMGQYNLQISHIGSIMKGPDEALYLFIGKYKDLIKYFAEGYGLNDISEFYDILCDIHELK